MAVRPSLLPFVHIIIESPNPLRRISPYTCTLLYVFLSPFLIQESLAQEEFNHLHILGWLPWSHIIALSHDIMLLTWMLRFRHRSFCLPYCSGCCQEPVPLSTQLLDTAISTKTTAFAGVPIGSRRLHQGVEE